MLTAKCFAPALLCSTTPGGGNACWRRSVPSVRSGCLLTSRRAQLKLAEAANNNTHGGKLAVCSQPALALALCHATGCL